MIITCPCKEKKFEIDAALIPDNGRTLECGSCGQKWFYKKKLDDEQNISKNTLSEENDIPEVTEKIIKQAESNILKKNDNNIKNKIDKKIIKKDTALIKYEKKTNFTLTKFLEYIIVFIISFLALMIILDTFKNPISNFFPNIEQNLYSLYEIFKDILSFSKDLIK